MLIGIFPNLSKPHIEYYVNTLCAHLDKARIDFYIDSSYRKEAEERGLCFITPNWDSWQQLTEKTTIAFSLGGDGSIIRIAKQLVDAQIPICGINLGYLGFLNVIEPDDLDIRLQQIKEGDYSVYSRTLLKSSITEEYSAEQALPLAMNEVVVGRSKPGRMVRVQLYVNDVFVEEYPADGIIVSTATGSTGYALSCGGPILHPRLDNIIVLPICPHLLKSSPIILAATDKVTITMPEREKYLYASIDGNESFRFTQNRQLNVTKHEKSIPFVYFKDQNFFRLLFPKLTKSIYHSIS